MVAVSGVAMGQKQKKVQSFSTSRIINAPANKVWKVVGEDYGSVAYSHPKIISSDYEPGTLKAGEGAERVCYFNEKQTQFLKEKMINYDPAEMRFTNTVFQAGKFPVDPNYTKADYKLEDLGNGSTKMSFDMQYRTKPGFMGAMAKGKFRKLINDYFIAIEHYVNTGEEVTKDNFRTIKKQYVVHNEKNEDDLIASSLE